MSRPTDPRLAEIWQQLELPPPAPVPHGFATRVVAQCRARNEDQLPTWVHAAAILSLILGLGLGLGLGPGLEPENKTLSAGHSVRAVGSMPSLSELYWSREELVDQDRGELP